MPTKKRPPMGTCPHCKAKVFPGAKTCPKCKKKM
jgi:hypothetical protein